MMEILKIELFVPGKTKPEPSTTISLNVIEHGKKLIPTKIKTILEREGIKISQLAELAEKEKIRIVLKRHATAHRSGGCPAGAANVTDTG